MSRYVIREPKPSDAKDIGAAHVAVWKSTYAGMVNEKKLAALNPEDSAMRWRRIISGLADQKSRGVVTRLAIDESDGHVAGFATGGIARDDDAPYDVELWSLNVVAADHGTGIAAQLMTAVIGSPQAGAYLWVATGNRRAIAFYRKQGFEIDGVTRFDSVWDCYESRMQAARSDTVG